MKKRLSFLLVACIIFATPIFAQFNLGGGNKDLDLSEEIKLDGKVRYGKLDNGITYYVRSNKKPENRAQFFLAVNAGSVLETETQLGLAHFCEHMNFNGTKQFPGNSMISELEKKGIVFGRDINAYTSFDETVYNVELPTDDPELFAMGLKILDGWAGKALLTGEEIDKERGVIIEEWRTGQGAGERLRQKTWATLLNGSRYASRLPIGTLENLQNFKYEHIRDYYTTWYRPDNMAIIIVGDFDADKMEQQVVDYFRLTPPACQPLEKPHYDVPGNKEPLITIATDKEATSNQIMYVYKHPEHKTKTIGDFRNNELLPDLFNTMINERLTEISNDKNCPYMQAYASYSGFIGPTECFMGVVVAKENKIEDALKATLTENQRILQHGFTQTELDRAKESLLTAYSEAAKEETKTYSETFARQYVSNFLDQTPVPGARVENRYAKKLIEGITLDEINALAKQWITEENFVMTVQMPENAKKKPTEASLKKVIEKVKKSKTTPWTDNVKQEPFLAKEPKAGKVKTREDNAEFGYTKLVLNNGATVYLKPNTASENKIQINAWSAGGASLYADKDIINVQYAADMIDESGIGNYTHSDLQKFMKGKTFGLTPYISNLYEGLSGSTGVQDLETMLQYIYMFFEAPRKDQQPLDKFISNMKTQLPLVENMPEFAFQKGFFKAMYPNDKRTILLPSEKQLSELNIDKMYKIFRERFSNASDFSFAFVGSLKIDEIIPLIEKYIGGISTTNKTEKWQDRTPVFAKGIVDEVVYKGEADKGSMILASERPFTWTEKERRATSLLEAICDIRLTETIREEMGGTYSPSFQLSFDNEPKSHISMVVYYSCDPQNVEALTTATWKVLDDLITNGPSEEILAKVKEQRIRAREKAVETNGYWMSVISSMDKTGENIVSFDSYKKSINDITVEDIKAVAAKYINHNEYVRVALKPEKMNPDAKK